MRKYIYSLFAVTLMLLAAGCSKDDEGSKKVDPGVVGEWHQTKWNDESQADFDVYIEFLADGRFNIFQQVETSTYMKYSGGFQVEGKHLTGTYSSGESWRSSYDYELSGDGNTLTMTSTSSTAVVSIYTKTTIPEEVRNVREVRAALPEGFLPIL